MRALTGLLTASAVPAAGAATVDVVEFPTGFFAPDEAATFASRYHRDAN